MTVLELVAVKLGQTLVKSACETVTGSKLAGDLADVSTGVLGNKATDFFQRRDTERALRGIADEVAKRVLSWSEHEYRDVRQEDRIGTVEAVTDTFEQADTGVERVVSSDLDPRILEQHVRTATPNLLRDAGLGNGEQLYDLLLRQSCAEVVRIARKLPNFQATAFGEILQRLTTMLDEMRDNSVETLARLDELCDIARATAAQGSLKDLEDRLPRLAVIDRVALIERWMNAEGPVWTIIVALTDPREQPADTLAEWEADPPSWLVSAPSDARLVAAELAATYGARRLAADLFAAVASDGAARRQFWYARAALLYDELDERERARQILGRAGQSLPLTDPFARALAAVFAEDWDRARDEIKAWQPQDTLNRVLHFTLYTKETWFSCGDNSRDALDRLIELSGSVLRDEWITGIAFVRAFYLVARAEMAQTDHPYADLKEARELAVRVRDDRRLWRRDSSDAVALACRAAVAARDYQAAVALGTAGTGGTTEVEAASPQVRHQVVLARAALGDMTVDVSREDAADAHTYAVLKAHVATRRGEDAVVHWREALDAATDDDQKATALAGLARCGHSDLPELDEFAARFPELGAELRAMADLARGDTGAAVATLRTLARRSLPAALTLATAYDRMGDVDGVVETLCQAADDFHDPQLRFEAVIALRQADRARDAERELDLVLAAAPADWPGRANAQRLGAQLALEASRVERATDLLRAAVASDPLDTPTRWNLIRMLLSRQETDAAWRVFSDHPHSLEPLGVQDAHAWIELHREHGDAETTVRGCLRIMGQFPDSEELATHALLVLVGPGPPRGELPDGVLAALHSAMGTFFERWPDSTHLRRLTLDADPSNVLAQFNELARTTAEDSRGRRELATRAVLGQVPLSVLAAVVHRSYAEVVLRRGVDVLPAWHPDPAEHVACTQAALQAFDGVTVIDTASAVVLGVLPAAVRTKVLGAFRRVIVADDVLRDARIAQATLRDRSSSALIWNEEAQSAQFVESPPQFADQLADESERLVDTIRNLHPRPRPSTTLNQRFSEATFGPCAATLDLAAVQTAPIWADDAALRTVARSFGLPVISTPGVLEALAQRQLISTAEHRDALLALFRSRVGDIPLGTRQLLEIAESENWEVGAAAVALSRPVAWTNPSIGLERALLILKTVQAHSPRMLAGWTYQCVRGATYANTGNPQFASTMVSAVLATALNVASAQGEQTRTLVTVARRGLADASIDRSTIVDPLSASIRFLHGALVRSLTPTIAAQYLLGMTSALDEQDRQIVLRSLLQ